MYNEINPIGKLIPNFSLNFFLPFSYQFTFLSQYHFLFYLLTSRSVYTVGYYKTPDLMKTCISNSFAIVSVVQSVTGSDSFVANWMLRLMMCPDDEIRILKSLSVLNYKILVSRFKHHDSVSIDMYGLFLDLGIFLFLLHFLFYYFRFFSFIPHSMLFCISLLYFCFILGYFFVSLCLFPSFVVFVCSSLY